MSLPGRSHLILPGILLMFLSVPVPAFAQDDAGYSGLFLGIGVGQDVGGMIGAKATYWVAPYLAGFAGGGWAVVDGGYNLGVEVRLPSRSRASFFATGMYGYNAVIQVKGKEQLNGIYYGPTAGLGLMLRQRLIANYWRFSLNYPSAHKKC